MVRPSPPVAFVLSGGAGLGAIQVGMLRALYERGIAPDLIVATSAGAINGAFIATRTQTEETPDELATIWRHMRRGQVFPLNPLGALLGFLGTRAHLARLRPAARTARQSTCACTATPAPR
ncbi:MAG: patatin-like phospholipase family protein [Solirubrobacteraceae bacterium]